jgi:hypothetical protein
MKTPPTYTSPFSSREEILCLVREYLEGDTKSPITEDKCLLISGYGKIRHIAD